MLEKAKKDIHAWVKVLKNIGYNFPEELWEIKPGTSGIPEELDVTFSGEKLSFEEMKKLAEKLNENFPEFEGDDVPNTNCRLDYDKYFMPNMETGLCLWVWTYNENQYGICMTNCW